MNLEDLKLNVWYVIMTTGSKMCGAPVCVKEISAPFVLALDFMDDMVVLDTREEKLGSVSDKYVRTFRRLWKKQVARKRQEAEELRQTTCVECGIDVTALAEDDDE